MVLAEDLSPCYLPGDEPEPLDLIRLPLAQIPELVARGELHEARAIAALFMVENFGAALITRVGEQAPGMRLRFVQKPDKDSTPLRDGTIDLETGVVGKDAGPELRTQALFRDRFIGVVRMGHPLSQGEITPARYAAGRHIYVSRWGSTRGPSMKP